MNQKYNESFPDYSKFLKQEKYSLEEHIGKGILGKYVENIEDFNNATGSEDKKKIKREEFNKWMAYL